MLRGKEKRRCIKFVVPDNGKSIGAPVMKKIRNKSDECGIM